MHARQLDGDDLEGADDPAVLLGDEVADLVLGEVFEDLGAQLFLRLARQAASEDGRERLVVREQRRQLDQGVEVVARSRDGRRPARPRRAPPGSRSACCCPKLTRHQASRSAGSVAGTIA